MQIGEIVRKWIFFTCVIICASMMIFCGCVNREQSDTREVSIAKLKAENEKYIDSIKKIKTKNLSVSNSLILSIPDKVISGEYICADGYQNNSKKIFSHYVSNYDEKNITINDSYYPTGPDYNDPETGLTMSIGCTGFFSYMTKAFTGQDIFDQSKNNLIKTYAVGDLDSSDHYSLSDGTDISVADTVKMVQEFADDYVKASGFENGLKVLRVNLYQNDAGYYYEIDLSQSVDEMPILDYHPIYDDDETIVVPSSFAYVMGDGIEDFAVNSLFKPYKADSIDKVIDPAEAVRKVSEYLAKNMNLELKRVSLECSMIKKDSTDDTKNGKTEAEIVFRSNDIYEAVPCWIFYFDESAGKEVYARYNISNGKIVFVNNKG